MTASSALFPRDHTWRAAYGSGSSSTRKYGPVRGCCKKDHKNRVGALQESWGCSSCRRQDSKKTLLYLLNISRRLMKKIEKRLFTKIHSDRRSGNGFKRKGSRCNLDIRKKFFIIEVQRTLEHVAQRTAHHWKCLKVG